MSGRNADPACLFDLAQSCGLNVSVAAGSHNKCGKNQKNGAKRLTKQRKRTNVFLLLRRCDQNERAAFAQSRLGEARRRVIFMVTNRAAKTSEREGIMALGPLVSPLHGNVQAISCSSIPASASVGVRGAY